MKNGEYTSQYSVDLALFCTHLREVNILQKMLVRLVLLVSCSVFLRLKQFLTKIKKFLWRQKLFVVFFLQNANNYVTIKIGKN